MLWSIFVYIAVYFGLFTGIFFLFTFFENMDGLKERKPKRFPKVSIIVPAYKVGPCRLFTSLISFIMPTAVKSSLL